MHRTAPLPRVEPGVDAVQGDAIATRFSRRPAAPGGDDDFLFRLYQTSAMATALAALPLAPDAIATLLGQQYEARRADYRARFPAATIDIVVVDEQPVGVVHLASLEAETRVVDLALLPACRNQGLGRALLEAVMREAAAAGRAVTLSVAQDNPAARLYRRLGFVETQTDAIYRVMRWTPAAR